MKITIIGSGYVGLVTGACLAELGNDVFCLDLDTAKINFINQGGVPIYEPGLQEIIQRNRQAGRLHFSSDVKASVEHGQIQFIAVGTPPGEDGSADLQYVLAAAKNIGQYMNGFKVVVDKSTVPVGTADLVREAIGHQLQNRNLNIEFSVISNPEFLKEGAAVEDFMRPDRIVIGAYSDVSGQKAKELMRQLYAPFNRHHERTFYMDVKSAELTKYAANAMLATRISFMNELANLADVVGADIEMVRQGIGSDSRIGYSFLYAGTGYGGSCFPKDVQALVKTADINGQDLKILKAVEAANELQKLVLLKKINTVFPRGLANKKIAVWGLAFKPNTDDMREAPSRKLIAELIQRGAKIFAHDPVANQEAHKSFMSDLGVDQMASIQLFDSMTEVLNDADALVIMTEWKAFKSPNFDDMKNRMKSAVIFDGRNLYEPTDMKELGFLYYPVGRNSIGSI